jgi:hypothetical protein
LSSAFYNGRSDPSSKTDKPCDRHRWTDSTIQRTTIIMDHNPAVTFEGGDEAEYNGIVSCLPLKTLKIPKTRLFPHSHPNPDPRLATSFSASAGRPMILRHPSCDMLISLCTYLHPLIMRVVVVRGLSRDFPTTMSIVEHLSRLDYIVWPWGANILAMGREAKFFATRKLLKGWRSCGENGTFAEHCRNRSQKTPTRGA